MKKQKGLKGGIIMLWILGVLVILAAIFVALTVNKEITLTINGDDPVVVSYGSVYTEPGAEAVWHCRMLSFIGGEAEVVVNGEVDTSKVGTYTIKYTSDYKNSHAEAERTVNVVDDEAPVISLKTGEDYYTLPGEDYIEEGYTAYDNVDGILTDKVVREEKDGVVTYTVKDAAGNSTTVTRNIVYDDREAPVITLDGPDQVTVGNEWNCTYKARDNVDGDITDKVIVTGTVDINTPGTYEVTYSVVDTYDNKTEVKKTVTVLSAEKGSQPWGEAVTGTKIVFLTFDDGPGEYTEEILDTLKEYDVKATFFVTDQFPEYQDLLAREADEGHTVCVHSYSHDYSIYTSEDEFWQDFDSMNDVIENWTGARSDIFRFPGGSSNTASAVYNEGIMSSLVFKANELNLDYYDWNVDSGDSSSSESSEDIAANVIAGMENNEISVVLMHDVNEATAGALETIIQYGMDNGYTFMSMYKGCFTCHHEVNN